jgi:hypothetical protein
LTDHHDTTTRGNLHQFNLPVFGTISPDGGLRHLGNGTRAIRVNLTQKIQNPLG